MSVWCCAQTASSRESSVAATLERWGYETFLPAYVVKDRSRHLRVKMLFPGYLLVRLPFPEAWPRIQRAEHVVRVLTHQQTDKTYVYPATLANAQVELLRAQTSELNELCRAGHSGRRSLAQVITKDCMVRILQGTFAGKEALCLWTDRERVKLLVAMFGRQVIAEFYRRDVEVAS